MQLYLLLSRMKEILVGIVSGIISGLGMGGGTILITFLTCFLGISQIVAQASNIIFFVPTSIIATIVNVRNNTLKWKVAIPLVISGVIGAAAGSIIANKLNTNVLKKAFAIFLIFIVIYQIICWYRKYIKRHNIFRR